MKISNETKVGILAIAAILLLVMGFNFLKGKSLFKKTPTYYAIFKKIGSLEKSNAVKINGLVVGTVYDMVPMDKEVDRILVELHLSRDINIPRNSVAYIDGSLVGASYINIEKGEDNAYLKMNDTISTRLEGGIMSDLKSQLTPTITRVNETIDTLRTTLSSINSIFDPNTKNNMRTLVANLTITSAHLQQLLAAQSGVLGQALNNMNAVAGNLAKNNDAITSSIRNVEIATSRFANINLQPTIDAFQSTAEQLKATVSKINTNNGTLGALMNDKKLYDQLNRVALGMEILLDDIRVNPKRYVNISILGSKTKGEPITSPAPKDTLVVTKQ